METLKPKTPETPSMSRLRRAGLVGALTLMASMAPAVSPAEAATHARHNKTHTREHLTSLKQLNRQTEQALSDGRSVAHWRGTAIYEKTVHGRHGRHRTVTRAIREPLVVFRGNPKEQFGHDDIDGKDKKYYAFGSLKVDAAGKPHVTLHAGTDVRHIRTFADATEQPVGSVAFAMTTEGVDFNTPIEPTGEPIVDDAGNPEVIGQEISGGHTGGRR